MSESAMRTGLTSASAARRRAHAVGPARQQLVAEQAAQAGEVVAHRRLPEVDAGGGLGDAAFRQQRVKSDEEIEIDPA